MMIRLYHNPTCSKSRASLALLREHGVEPTIIEYLKTPPTTTELDRICSLLELEPTEITRNKESLFKELGLSLTDNKPRAEWLQILVQNPILIERPIALNEHMAVIGRPPENVLQLV